MKNIFVVGTSGSGKSTLAREIAAQLNIKHIELDELLWLPNWEKREPNEFNRILKQLMKENPRVVIDGNFLARGFEPSKDDLLVFLDLARPLVFSRILRRTIRRVVFREKLWSGNQEEWKFLFSMDPEVNPVLFSWITHKQRSQRYAEYIASKPELKTYRIANREDLKKFRKGIQNL